MFPGAAADEVAESPLEAAAGDLSVGPLLRVSSFELVPESMWFVLYAWIEDAMFYKCPVIRSKPTLNPLQ